jgi:hypothetical protein
LVLAEHEAVLSLIFAPQGNRVAVVTNKGRVIFHDPAGKTSDRVHTLPIPERRQRIEG